MKFLPAKTGFLLRVISPLFFGNVSRINCCPPLPTTGIYQSCNNTRVTSYIVCFFNNHKKHFVLVFPEVPKKIWFYKNLMRSLLLYTNKTNDWFLASRVFMFFVTVVQNLQVWIFFGACQLWCKGSIHTLTAYIKKEKKKKRKKELVLFWAVSETLVQNPGFSSLWSKGSFSWIINKGDGKHRTH